MPLLTSIVSPNKVKIIIAEMNPAMEPRIGSRININRFDPVYENRYKIN